MSGWAGFSDHELRKLQQMKEPVVSRGRRAAAAGRSRQQLQRERALQASAQRAAGAPLEFNGAPPGAELRPGAPIGAPPGAELRPGAPPGAELLSGAPAGAPPGAELLSGAPAGARQGFELRPGAPAGAPPGAELRPGAPPGAELLSGAPTGAPPGWGPPAVGEEAQKPSEDQIPAVKELEEEEVELREKTRLEQLQQEQKIIEERNKRKKALLAKTIAEKSKQTHAEAAKLKRIQKELQDLDDMVSNDIGILRGKIEQASWDYSAARKRYDKAESEYVTAKMNLHKKTEVKEQLMEHLCAIIQQNELRKAHKLEELMQQLQLHPNQDQAEGEGRSCVEAPPSGKEENGLPRNREGNARSSDDGRTAEEKPVQAESGGGVQEAPKTEAGCQPHGELLQSQTAAS